MPIKTPYGDYIEPGKGNPTNWADLPLEDQIEDLSQVLSKKRSFGPNTDKVLKRYIKATNGNLADAIRNLVDDMHSNKLPPIPMWESDFTELPKYKEVR